MKITNIDIYNDIIKFVHEKIPFTIFHSYKTAYHDYLHYEIRYKNEVLLSVRYESLYLIEFVKTFPRGESESKIKQSISNNLNDPEFLNVLINYLMRIINLIDIKEHLKEFYIVDEKIYTSNDVVVSKELHDMILPYIGFFDLEEIFDESA